MTCNPRMGIKVANEEPGNVNVARNLEPPLELTDGKIRRWLHQVVLIGVSVTSGQVWTQHTNDRTIYGSKRVTVH